MTTDERHEVADAVGEAVAIAQTRSLLRSGAARSIRVAAGLSQSDVAQGIGVRPSTVLRWENGTRNPRGPAALRYLALLEELMAR